MQHGAAIKKNEINLIWALRYKGSTLISIFTITHITALQGFNNNINIHHCSYHRFTCQLAVLFVNQLSN
jgi:hypothetical protein